MGKWHVCICCQRRAGRVNSLGFCGGCATCLHCEMHPSVSELGLCQRCEGMHCVANLYIRRPGWSPEWEQHLRALTWLHQEEMKRRGYGRNSNGRKHESAEEEDDG